MARWITQVDIKPPIHAASEGDISTQEACKQVAQELRRLDATRFAWAHDSAEELETLAEAPEVDTEDFDAVLYGIYNHADADRVWLGL